MNSNLLLLPIIVCVLGAILSSVIFKKDEKKNHIFLFSVVALTSIITWILLFVVEGE